MDPVQKALWYVESHSREPITLEEVANACKISAFHFSRLFAATMGLSLMRSVRARPPAGESKPAAPYRLDRRGIRQRLARVDQTDARY
jgi:AraC-like DNA-binding protein